MGWRKYNAEFEVENWSAARDDLDGFDPDELKALADRLAKEFDDRLWMELLGRIWNA